MLKPLEHCLSIGVTRSSGLKSPFFGNKFDPNGRKSGETCIYDLINNDKRAEKGKFDLSKRLIWSPGSEHDMQCWKVRKILILPTIESNMFG